MKHIAITLSLLAIAMIPLRGGDWYDGGLGRQCICTHGQPDMTCQRMPGLSI